MKLEVWKPKEEVPPETILRLKLVRLGFDVVLCVCDEDGHAIPGGNIASLYQDGTLRLHASISEDFGLQLDERGRIKISD